MQYPKMLCKGTQAKYEYQIANDEQHEDALRKDGFDDYPNLPINSDQASDQLDQSKADYEEMTSEELRDLLEEKGIELEQENAELRKKLRIKELEDTSADDLKALLTERNIQFGARDSKAVLLNLVIESDGGE